VTITNLASKINYVDFAGKSGNDLGVLPSTGFNPITIDAGLDTSKKGFQLAGSGSSVGTNANSNVNATLNRLIGGTTNTASGNNNFSDPQYNLTPIARERNRNVRNNTGSNSGTGTNPPSENTDKIVYGKVIDWDSQVRNELTFKNLSNGTTESFYKFTPFTYDGFKTNNRRVIVQVDTIQYLVVGDIIYSQLTEKGQSLLSGGNNTFDIRYVKIEIKNIIAPNLVEGVYLMTDTGGIGSNRFLNIKTNPYEQRHKWDIIKKAVPGGTGGGGGNSGTRIPL
jgi:hypothetical protein